MWPNQPNHLKMTVSKNFKWITSFKGQNCSDMFLKGDKRLVRIMISEKIEFPSIATLYVLALIKEGVQRRGGEIEIDITHVSNLSMKTRLTINIK